MTTIQSLHIDRHKNAEGLFVDHEGCEWSDQSPEGFIMNHILEFCGCGMPDRCLAYIRDVLRHTKRREAMWEITDKSKMQGAVDAWENDSVPLYGPLIPEGFTGMRYFVLYALDRKGLLTHGSSVHSCYLTDKGRELLEDLEKLELD